MRLFPTLLLAAEICGCLTGLTSRAQAQVQCRDIAAPPPLFSFGGPVTAAPGQAEVAFGGGVGGTLFDPPCIHKTGSGWGGRWRTGVTDKMDMGVDLLVAQHQDEGTITGKLALRYRILPRVRLEGGAGAADDSEGKALNSELGVTVGTVNRDSPWEYYASARVAVSRGFPGDISGSGTNVPPNALVGLGTIGAAGRMADKTRFCFEAGAGPAFVQGYDGVGRLLYIGVAIESFIGP